MFEDNDDNYNRPIHEYLPCTVKEAMAMMLSYYSRHKLSWNALEDLSHLINSILGVDSLPTTKYVFKQKFTMNPVPTIHLICEGCNMYLGPKDTIRTREFRCNNCRKLCSIETKYKKNHFVTLPIENQITSMLNRVIEKDHFIMQPQFNGDIRDVFDGETYRNLHQKMNGRRFITLYASTDGKVILKSAKKKSLWPIQFVINEIKPEYRYKRENIICAAFGFGATPHMGSFFKTFIEEINSINSRGGLDIRIDGRTLKYLVILLGITMDSVAKCHVAAITQYNGHNGCPYCHHPGDIIPPAKIVKYCVRSNSQNREHNRSKEAMVQAYTTGNVIDGYRGISPVIALDILIDINWIFPIDKMHSIDLGVVKKFFTILIDRQNRNAP